MKTIIRRLSLLLVVCIFILQLSPLVSASETSSEVSIVYDFVEMISSTEPDFMSWQNAAVTKAYDLFAFDNTVAATLYYVGTNGDGYVILDTNGLIVEFAVGSPAYDAVSTDFDFAIYQNGCYYISSNGTNIQIYADGTFVKPMTFNNSRTILDMEANLQVGATCIPTSIAHIFWYWGQNGYPTLTNNRTFQDVVDELVYYMGDYYQYQSGIASGVVLYTNARSMYGTSQELSPAFDSIVSEINAGRPCLLGYASGGDYVGAHMTACCGYYVTSYANYAIVVDGHHTTRVYKVWSTYNDFVCRIRVAM